MAAGGAAPGDAWTCLVESVAATPLAPMTAPACWGAPSAAGDGDSFRSRRGSQGPDLSAFELSRRGSEVLESKGSMTPRPAKDPAHARMQTPSSKGTGGRKGVRFNLQPVLSKVRTLSRASRRSRPPAPDP